MTWSIYLSGNKFSVQRELQAAHDGIKSALSTINSLNTDCVAVSVSGSGYESPNGEANTSVSYSVTGHRAPVPPPQPVEAVETDSDIPF